MNRLKKRRPSSPTRPSTGFSTTSNNSYDSATSRTIRSRSGVTGLDDGYVEIMRSGEKAQRELDEKGTAKTAADLRKGLPQLDLTQGDFRGSVIIGSLSKRFSVLRFDDAPPSQAAPPDAIPRSASSSSILSSLPPKEQDARIGRERSGDRYHAVVPLPTSARSFEMSPTGSTSSPVFSPISATARLPPFENGQDRPTGLHSSSTTSIASTSSGSGVVSSVSINRSMPAQPRGSGWPTVSLSEIKQRLALQRQKGGLNHIREEEEDRVLNELMAGERSAAGKGIAWGAQGAGQTYPGAVSSDLPRSASGGSIVSGSILDFRSSPSIWGKELQNSAAAGGSGMSRSATAPALGTMQSKGDGARNPGAVTLSTMLTGIAPSQTLPDLTAHSVQDIPTPSVPRSTSASNLTNETRGGSRGFGFSGVGKMSDERMMILAMQKKGRQREKARSGVEQNHSEELGEIRFGEEDTEAVDPGQDAQSSAADLPTSRHDTVAGDPEGDTPTNLPPLAFVSALKPKKRQSYIAGLSTNDVARISKALWEVEDEMFKQLMREIDDEESINRDAAESFGSVSLRKGSTDTVKLPQISNDGPSMAELNNVPGLAVGKEATPPPRVKRVNSRRKPSITRSPAFHENLAAVVEAEQAMGAESGHGPSSHANFSGFRAEQQDIHNGMDVFSSGRPETAVRSASPVVIRPLRKSASGENLPSPTVSEHSRSVSASAVPISKTAIERGYSPGQSRPYTPERSQFQLKSATSTPSPTDYLRNESLTPPANSQPMLASRTVNDSHRRDLSKGLSIQPPPHRVGSLLSSYSSNGLPSVSPVVESFEESTEVMDGHQDFTYAPCQPGVPLNGIMAGSDYNDVSFDAEGYYGDLSEMSDDEGLARRESIESLASSYRNSLTSLDLYDLLKSSRTADHSSDVPQDSWEAKDCMLSYEEMRAAQSKLIEAARSVREAMRGSSALSPTIPSGSGLVSYPRAADICDSQISSCNDPQRARPSVRARKLETTVYYDGRDGLSQMARALSPSTLGSGQTAGSQRQGALSSTSSVMYPDRAPPDAPATPTADPGGTLPVAMPHGAVNIAQAQEYAPLQLDEGAKARLARALFGPEESAPKSGHHRTESTNSTGSIRLDENPDVVKDFEDRIARANASMQRNASMSQRIQPKSKALLIGSPILVDTSSVMKVTPILSPDRPQMRRKASSQLAKPAGSSVASPTIDQGGFLDRRPSVGGNSEHESTTGRGFRGFISKLKRKDSRAKASPRTASQASPSPSEMDTPTLGSSLKRKPSTVAVVSHVLQKAPSLSRRNKVGLGLEGFDMITSQEASIIAPPLQERRTRNDVVRRTIIIANPDQLGMDLPQQPRNRKISTRRKPVQYQGDEIGEEHLTSPVVPDSGAEPAKAERPSSSNSLLDYYAGADGSSSSSVAPSVSRGSTLSRAIEIREMSDGALVWGVVDGREAEAGMLDGQIEGLQRKGSTTTDDSAYSDDYREIIRDTDEVPVNARRPETQIFYSAPDRVADLVNELSDSGHRGNFRIIPTTQEPVQERLNALMSRLKATPREG